jgi:hypothetical protein
MNAHIRQGFRDATSTLGAAWPIAALLASAFVLGLAGVLEGQATASASTARAIQLRLLHGVAFGLVVPLFAFATTGRLGASAPELMRASWTRYGGRRRGYALGHLALATLLTGLVAAAAGWFALGLGSATSAPALALPLSGGNLVAVVWVGLLGGFAYVAGLCLAQVLGGRLGRLAFLAGDWLLGSGTSVLALPWPRAHLRTLLGGAAPLELGPRDAALCLLAIALASALAWSRLLRD